MIDFSFNTLLFVLTHCEELNNLNIEEKRKEINNVIYSNDVLNFNIPTNTNFLITYFSNELYKIYLKDLKISGNIVELYKYLKKSITNILIKKQ